MDNTPKYYRKILNSAGEEKVINGQITPHAQEVRQQQRASDRNQKAAATEKMTEEVRQQQRTSNRNQMASAREEMTEFTSTD